MFHLLSQRRVWLQLDVYIVSWCVNSFCCSLLFGCRLNRFRQLNILASNIAESIEVGSKKYTGNWTHLGTFFPRLFPLKSSSSLAKKQANWSPHQEASMPFLMPERPVAWHIQWWILGKFQKFHGDIGGNITSNQEYAMGYKWWILPI